MCEVCVGLNSLLLYVDYLEIKMADIEPETEVPLLLGHLEECQSYQEEEPNDDEVGVESLDYDPIHSLVYSQQKKGNQRRHFYG